ncbi:COG4280 domain-containing protein [Arthrobacter sp. KN11-1C]|uniref:COG4280 domain-containing protein n=1 Tax=Arthrobacter sp. KN11-1C TaxID=3445774 RepID=UPI003F9F2CA2
MNTTALLLSVFLACLVEAVEAATIVLAAGTARDWRSALSGVGVGLVVLAAVVIVFGPAIALIPLDVLRVLVGGLLLVFGLQWMRKAILRASGHKALHDEDAIYRREFAAAQSAAGGSRFGVGDWYAFTLSFKGVLLEGLEVAFIVVTFGNIQGQLGLAAWAAAAAVVLVAVAAIIVRGPLSRVPENTMKFIVGIMLTSFGIFWGAEGAGAVWPVADLSLLVIIPSLAVIALAIVAVLRRRPSKATPAAVTAPTESAPTESAPTQSVQASGDAIHDGGSPAGASMEPGSPEAAARTRTVTAGITPAAGPRKSSVAGSLKRFGLFWYDFIIGDDWRVALAIAASFAVTAALSSAGVGGVWWVVPAVAVLTLPMALSRLVRTS